MAELPRQSTRPDLGGRGWVRRELERDHPDIEISDDAIDAVVKAAWAARADRTARDNRNAGGPWWVALREIVKAARDA